MTLSKTMTTLIKEVNEREYKMEVYNVPTKFGTIRETHFTRHQNVHNNLSLKTIIREWKNKEGKNRENKRFVIFKDGKEYASIYANTRWDSVNNRVYYENKQEIDLFFTAWQLAKEISDLTVALNA